MSISKGWALYWKLCRSAQPSSSHPPKLIHQPTDRRTVRLEGARKKSQLIQPKMPTHRTMFETFVIWRQKTQNISVSWVGSGIRKTRVWNLHMSGHLWILSKVLSFAKSWWHHTWRKATILLRGIVHGVDEAGRTVCRTPGRIYKCFTNGYSSGVAGDPLHCQTCNLLLYVSSRKFTMTLGCMIITLNKTSGTSALKIE